MSIQGHLARVIEANRISGVKAYGEYQSGLVAWNSKVQDLMQQSLETGRKLNELLRKEAENAQRTK